MSRGRNSSLRNARQHGGRGVTFLCHFARASLSTNVRTQPVLWLFFFSCREINTTSKSAAAAPRGKRWAERMCHLHRKGCVFHSRDLSLPEQLPILPPCNGKDSALTSRGAELCWRHEMLKGENKSISGREREIKKKNYFECGKTQPGGGCFLKKKKISGIGGK